MKKSIIAFLALFLAIGISGISAQDRDQFNLEVEGLGCPFCAYGLEKKFKEFKGIKDIQIEMETGKFSFSYPAEKPLTLEQVREKVKEAGYTPMLTSVTRADGSIESNAPAEGAMASLGGMRPGMTAQFSVAGNCDMCKARIENTALAFEGVLSADWDSKTQLLDLQLSEKADKALSEKIVRAIAEAGHDSKSFRTSEEVYNNLPPCCLYR